MATKFIPSRNGVRELLRSADTANLIRQKTSEVVSRLPSGYSAKKGQPYAWVADVKVGNRAVGVIRPANVHTYNKCQKDNVLMDTVKSIIN